MSKDLFGNAQASEYQRYVGRMATETPATRGAGSYHLIHGRTPYAFSRLPAGKIAAVIADPPYCSGGMVAQKKAPTGSKYIDNRAMPDFTGDSMSEGSFSYLTEVWTYRAMQRGCQMMFVFIDWRQFPLMAKAIECAGWSIKNLLVWDKLNGRPAPNDWARTHEFIIYCTNGTVDFGREKERYGKSSVIQPAPPPPQPDSDGFPTLPHAVLQHKRPPSRTKIHQTEKPVQLLRELVRMAPAEGYILDPFAGSGSTLEAALLEKRDAVGIEVGEVFFEPMRLRLSRFGQQWKMDENR